jgi:hypothetical protein
MAVDFFSIPTAPYQIPNVLIGFSGQQVPEVPKGTSRLGKYRFDFTHSHALIVAQNVPIDSQSRRWVRVAKLTLGYRRARGLEKHARQGVAKCLKPNSASSGTSKPKVGVWELPTHILKAAGVKLK